MSHLKI